MGLFSQIEGPVRAVLDDLFADEDLRDTIMYRKYSGQSFDDTVGHNVNTFSESSVYAIRLRHTHRSALAGVLNIQIGDELYMFRYDDLPIGLSLKDEIVDENGVTQKVKQIQPIFGLATAITIEGGY